MGFREIFEVLSQVGKDIGESLQKKGATNLSREKTLYDLRTRDKYAQSAEALAPGAGYAALAGESISPYVSRQNALDKIALKRQSNANGVIGNGRVTDAIAGFNTSVAEMALADQQKYIEDVEALNKEFNGDTKNIAYEDRKNALKKDLAKKVGAYSSFMKSNVVNATNFKKGKVDQATQDVYFLLKKIESGDENFASSFLNSNSDILKMVANENDIADKIGSAPLSKEHLSKFQQAAATSIMKDASFAKKLESIYSNNAESIANVIKDKSFNYLPKEQQESLIGLFRLKVFQENNQDMKTDVIRKTKNIISSEREEIKTTKKKAKDSKVEDIRKRYIPNYVE
jgi:hypothetical protein